jgi:3'-5' exoribonuclease
MATTITPNEHHNGRAAVPAPGELARPAAEAAPAPIEISALKPGDDVDGLLACSSNRIVNAPQRGLTFLAVVLRDEERKIQARAFSRVHELAGQFERGDVVHVRGRVTTYEDEPQIRIEQIERHELTASAKFLPVAYRDLDELDGYLEHLGGEVGRGGYRALLGSVMSDRKLRAAWRTAPCSCSGHHAYLGGLLEHTVAVATLALETCALHPKLNPDLLLSAAILHDIGLTQSFDYSAEITDSAAGRMLGHVALGLELVRDHVKCVQLPEQAWRPLAHCILTHHGPRPALGRTYACAEALALQRLVAIDEGIKRAVESGWMA